MSSKQNKIVQLKKINLGIEILRVLLSYMVIIDHFYINITIKKKLYNSFLYYHIPSFFMISFYFTYNTLINFNIKKINLRFVRLIIPYIFWSTLGWILRIIYYHYLNINYEYKYKEFIMNMITGHIFNVALWFQAILIFLTIIFLIVIFIFKKNYLSVFIILTIICYIMQYSEVNYYFNYNHLQPHAYLTFGRLVEVFPDAVIGFILHSKNIMKKIKKKKLSFFISFIFLIIISKFNEFDNIKTFNYGGIRLNIAALCIFIIFYLLPFEKINNIKIIRLIRQITNYTGGIYYMHILIGNSYTISIILKSKKNTVFGCSLIYLICYILSGIGNKIFSKNNLRYIFS